MLHYDFLTQRHTGMQLCRCCLLDMHFGVIAKSVMKMTNQCAKKVGIHSERYALGHA